jgi:hypothetical protein
MLILGGVLIGVGIGFLWGYLRRPAVREYSDLWKAHDRGWAQREAVLALCHEPRDAGSDLLISADAVMAIYEVTS